MFVLHTSVRARAPPVLLVLLSLPWPIGSRFQIFKFWHERLARYIYWDPNFPTCCMPHGYESSTVNFNFNFNFNFKCRFERDSKILNTRLRAVLARPNRSHQSERHWFNLDWRLYWFYNWIFYGENKASLVLKSSTTYPNLGNFRTWCQACWRPVIIIDQDATGSTAHFVSTSFLISTSSCPDSKSTAMNLLMSRKMPRHWWNRHCPRRGRIIPLHRLRRPISLTPYQDLPNGDLLAPISSLSLLVLLVRWGLKEK
jgi:hypothetical protein